MYFCKECNTGLESKRDTVTNSENFEINAVSGKEMCLRCVAIVVNWMTGESLVSTGDAFLVGYKNLPTFRDRVK